MIVLLSPNSSRIIYDKNALFINHTNPGAIVKEHEAIVKTFRDHGIPHHLLPASLSLHPNSMFVRDIFIDTPAGILLGRAKHTIRSPEIEAMADWFGTKEARRPLAGVIQAPGVLEGGDVICAGGSCFIGIGARTNRSGARQLIRSGVLGADTTFFLVHGGTTAKPAEIHLDCLFMVIRPPGPRGRRGLCLLSEAHADKMKVDVARGPKDIPFPDLLAKEGYEIVFVPQEVQRCFGCNVLVSNEGRGPVVSQAPWVSRALRARKIPVVEVETGEIQKMGGGIRCMTNELLGP